ncbi:MAG: bifunctional aspartate kinase/homoserine dehydrogenase I [Xanthomonadales bacterium]|nr:bifunctional aspartate kinase/homoserine dehydrogenase I [Xanthomonadales bacterium]
MAGRLCSYRCLWMESLVKVIAHKFGGSSLADAQRIAHVAALLAARNDEQQVIVVSALQRVTDELLALGAAAAERSSEWPQRLEQLRQRHFETARALLGDDRAEARLEPILAVAANLLRGIELLGLAPEAVMSLLSGLGEVLSATLLTLVLQDQGRPAQMLDAREVLVVEQAETYVAVDWPATEQRLAQWRQAHPGFPVVVTGFVARDGGGHPTTLGRNGSDYSASIMGALFDADEIHIWTDVDGVLSADPRLVPDAFALPELSYEEAFELAYFGAKVIHPQTMAPATERGIPLVIRNTFNVAHGGTRIEARSGAEPPVKGLSTIDQLSLITIEGAGMIGVPGTAERVFGALRAAGVSVVMISQGSSEHSICFVVRLAEAQRAQRVLEQAFERELADQRIQRVHRQDDTTVLAVVGDGMAGRPGIAAQLFDSLGRAKVNIRAIAQGASERNISVAIAAADAVRALRAVHAGFYLSAHTLSIGLIGPGNVGRALLQQIEAVRPRLLAQHNIDLRLRAIASSRKMLLTDGKAAVDDHLAQFQAEAEPLDMARFSDWVQVQHLPHALILDCSAASAVADHYADWMRRGIHVVTPNKQAGGGPLARYRQVQNAARGGAVRWRYEATVGAGLPVIQTLRDLIDTGDQVLAIEGIFSGTLAWLFNRFDGSTPFSQLVAEARAAGYTEPDPRDDLSGLDVARKLVILARELQMDLELEQVAVESLVPESLRDTDPDGFVAGLSAFDDQMSERLHQARSAGKVLRYVARLDLGAGTAAVGLASLGDDHAFAHIRLTDNIVQYTTDRYRENPLVVQGPGAGPEVTAAGVLADLLRVAGALGAHV